jgi:tetratricopeptide (TPR) repeat protein
MTSRVVLLGIVASAAVVTAGWFAWRWTSTPVPPDFPIAQMEPAVAEAITEALTAVRREPRSGDTWGRLALVAAANGYTDQALNCLQHAESLDATNPRWPYLHGHLLQDGRAGDPLPLWRHALACGGSAGQRGTVLFRLALAQIEAAQLDEAEQHLQTLEELEGTSERVHLGRGLLAVARDDSATGREHLAAVLGSPHARKVAATDLAAIATAENDPTAAGYYRQRAAALPADAPWPDVFVEEMTRQGVSRDALMKESARLQDAGRLPEAVALIRKVIATTPDAGAYQSLGMALTKLCAAGAAPQLFAEAEDALNTALRLDPQQMQAHHFLATIRFMQAEKLTRAGDSARAKELFRAVVAAEDRALAIKPSDPTAHLTRAAALRQLGRTDEALESLRAAVRYRPGYADAHLALGEALAESGQLNEALRQLGDAVRFAAPDDRRPRDALAKWQARAKKP